MKIYDSKSVTENDLDMLYATACYFSDTKEEVRDKRHTGVLRGWTKGGFKFAGIYGEFRFLQKSASLNSLLRLIRKHDDVGEEMVKGYYSFSKSID